MTTPLAFGRHVAAPGDTVKGNAKVVEFGLFGGSACASPTAGASASAAVNIAVASFMENLLFPPRRVSPRTPRSLRGGALGCLNIFFLLNECFVGSGSPSA